MFNNNDSDNSDDEITPILNNANREDVADMVKILRSGLIHTGFLAIGLAGFNLVTITTDKSAPEHVEEIYAFENLWKYSLANAVGASLINTMFVVDMLKKITTRQDGQFRAAMRCVYEISTSWLAFAAFGLSSGLVDLSIAHDSDMELDNSLAGFFSRFFMKTVSAAIAVGMAEKMKRYLSTPDLLQLFMTLFVLTYTGQLNALLDETFELNDSVLTSIINAVVDIGAVTVANAPAPLLWLTGKKAYNYVSSCVGSYFDWGKRSTPETSRDSSPADQRSIQSP